MQTHDSSTATAGKCPRTIELLDPDFQQCPIPVWRDHMEDGKVSYATDINAFVVTGYDLCRQVVRDPATFSSVCGDCHRRPHVSRPVEGR